MDRFIPVEEEEKFVPVPEVVERGRRTVTRFTPTPKPTFGSPLIKNKAEEVSEKARILSSTLDIPYSLAYDHQEDLSKSFDAVDSNWLKTAKSSFKRGLGNTYVLFGRALEYAGLQGKISETAIIEGEKLKYTYAPPVKPEEFTFKKVLDPDWWATTLFENIPTTLALIPAALIAGYAGIGTAGAIGLGTFGKVLLGSIGGGVASRIIESAFEAAGTYDEELAKGKSEEEARARADFTFKWNMILLTGADIGQFLLAFTPLGKMGLAGTLSRRILATALKVGGVAAMEAGEEALQTAIQQIARGEKPTWGSEMKESVAVGGIFGLGLGGTGSVWTAINDMITAKADKKLLDTFETARQAKLASGATPEEAYMAGLDAMAETPEGKALVENIGKELVRMGKPEEVEVIKEVAEVAKPEEMAEVEEVITDEDIQAIGEEIIDPYDLVDQLEQEEILGKEKVEEKVEVEPEAEVEPEVGVEEPEPKPVKRIISEEAYQRAKSELSEKLRGLRVGVDPTVIPNMAVIGAYHIESGVRKFSEWSKVMIKEFGDEIKPYLRRIWKEAHAYLEAKLPTSKVKKVVRKATGQIKLSDVIREDKALAEAMRMVQTNSRIAFKEGKKEALAQAKRDFEQILFNARVKADILGFKQGFRVGSRLTNAHLRALFKENTEAMNESRKEIVKYIEENLPLDVRGKYLDAVIKHITPRRKERLFERVDREQERLDKRDLIREIEELKEMRGHIAVDYQKQIKEIIGDIDTKRITSKTVKKLQGLKDYIENQGIPSGIKTETIMGLKRLEMVPAHEMSVKDLTWLVNVAKQLTELGKLKARLKYQLDERERQKDLQKLIASTKNLDPEVGEEKTFIDRMKKGSLYLHLQSLQTLRAFDLMDGVQNYKGENVRLAKNLMILEAMGSLKAKAILDSAVTDIINIGMHEITDEQKVRIMINIRQRDGAHDQVNTLMKYYGYDDVPILTPQEEALIDILERYVTEYTEIIAAIYEKLTGRIFPRIERYILPLVYADEKFFYMNPDEITQIRGRTTHVEQGFTMERELNVKRLPSIEIFEIFERAINTQQWYIHMEPELQNIRHLVLTKEYYEAAGELNYQYWKDYLDVVARRGWSATAHATPFSSLLRHVRGNLTKAILGYKLSSIIMQPFAIFDAMAYAQAKYGTLAALEIAKEVTHAFVNPKFAKDMYDKSLMLQTRAGGEVAIEELFAKIGHSNSLPDKFVRGGLSLLLWADVKTATGVESAFKNILEKHGVPNAAEEAGFLMNLVSSSSEVTFRPLILSKGEAVRTLLTFQTFFLNRWGMIAHDLIYSGLIRGNWKAKYAAMVGLGIMVAAKLAEDETREFLYELTTGRELPDNVSILRRVMFAIPSNIPFFGNLFEIGKYQRDIIEIPAERVAANLYRFFDVFTKDEWDKKFKGVLKGVEAAITLAYGIPGTAQFFDLLEAVLFPEKEKKKIPRYKAPKYKGPKRQKGGKE